MKTIAVVGAKGTVGTTLVEFFKRLGHRVLSVDKDTELTLQVAAADADVVFVVTLPIEAVGSVIDSATAVMKSGSLLIHGTSIERPQPHGINKDQVLKRGIALCHLHFQFRPEVPLSVTLFGQHLTISGSGEGWPAWRLWVHEQFMSANPIVHNLAVGEHDQITSVSQLVHMLLALLVTRVWQGLPIETVRKAMRICGPPGRMLIRSVLRVGTGAKVAESVVYNHPLSRVILDQLLMAGVSLRQAIRDRKPGSLVGWLQEGRAIPDQEALNEWDTSTARLARFDADTQEPRFEFRFPPERNQLGLLAKVLAEFDSRGIDKTTTMAQKDPDGGCTIIVGVTEMSPRAMEAEQIIRSW